MGAGNVTKLANQIIVARNIAAMGEALVLAIKGGLAGSTVLNGKGDLDHSGITLFTEQAVKVEVKKA